MDAGTAATKSEFIDAYAAPRAGGALQRHRLSFAAARANQPVIEPYGMAEISTVIRRLRQNQVRCEPFWSTMAGPGVRR